MSLFKKMISLIKVPDKLTSGFARSFANNYLKGIGEVTRLDIDTKNKRLSADVELKGEPSPIKVSTAYFLEEKGDKLFVILNEFQSSREWMEILFHNHFAGKPFEIPEKLAGGVRMVLK